MAPKRKNTKNGGASYDPSRFVSAAVVERYDKSLNVVVRNCIPERGLQFGDYNLPDITRFIRVRGWDDYCKEPLAAMDPVVQKFYANAVEQKDGKTKVQGVTVRFDPSTINIFYGLDEVDDNRYRALEGNLDYEEVISLITNLGSGAQWKIRNSEYKSFPSKHLRRSIRV